jgi:hypothetical protein
MSEHDASADGAADGAPSESPEKKKRKAGPPRDPELWIHRSMEKYRKTWHAHRYRPSPEFFELADAVVETGRTLLGYDRLYVFWQVVQNVAKLPGVAAEIGTYQGGSAYFIAASFVGLAGAEVPFHVFDTFEGHPASAISEQDEFQTAGKFAKTSYDDVSAYLSPFKEIRLYKGDVRTSMPGLAEASYRFVHVDTDLYGPTKACLEYFAPRMVPGGVFVLDDYASPKCPGVRAALSEFVDQTDAFQVWDLRTEQLILVKR